MNTHQHSPTTAISIMDLIMAHVRAVVADEATFSDDGLSPDLEASALTLAAEIGAYRNLVLAPCHSAADVQAKVGYLLNGTIGQRDSLADLLVTEEYAQGGNLLSNFLGSLITSEGIMSTTSMPDVVHSLERMQS